MDYLLNTGHPDGKAKAEFFTRFGFSLDRWQTLAHAFQAHGRTFEVVSTVESRFGKRYVVEGPLQSPDGRDPLVRTVWIIDQDNETPRLITAYPREEGA